MIRICEYWRDGDCLATEECEHKDEVVGGCSAPFGEVEVHSYIVLRRVDCP